jgi:SAM-dependent methyltransferase
VHAGDALAPVAAAAPVDRVLCVDAAYHFSPRAAWLRHCARVLRPGGRLAYTDLSVTPGPGAAGAVQRSVWRAAAALCGVPAGELLPLPAQVARLQALGFDEVRAEVLDAPVLDGFAAFVARQAAQQGLSLRHPGWRRVALTARLIGPCRRAGLGYALLSARWPG